MPAGVLAAAQRGVLAAVRETVREAREGIQPQVVFAITPLI